MKPSIETIDFHGLAAFKLNGPKGSSAIISKLGGQVLSWITPDGRERLYLSECAVFDGSVAIRGGIPVCFPQFSDLGELPKHGFVRTRQWITNAERCADDYALVTLQISNDESTLALWPHMFTAEITVMLEVDRIDVEFCVTNTGSAPFDFTCALHSYLRQTQVEDVSVEGLYGHHFRDATKDNQIIRDSGIELVIEQEVDRVYHDVQRPQQVNAGNLSLTIENQTFPDVVIWNPWVERCAELKDMPDDDWKHMLCIEAAVAQHPVTLPAGEEWYGRQTLIVA